MGNLQPKTASIEDIQSYKHIPKETLRTVHKTPDLFFLTRKQKINPNQRVSFKQNVVNIGADKNNLDDQSIVGYKNAVKCYETHNWKNPKTRSFTVFDLATDRFMKLFTRQICINTDNVQSLELTYQYCTELTDKGLDWLSSNLRNFPHLKHLKLEFKECSSITGKGLKFLASEISHNLPHLTSLDLTLKNAGVDEESFEFLCSRVCVYMSHLKRLRLHFANCVQITGEGLSVLGYGIVNHVPHLEDLSVEFFECRQISDLTFTSFASAITKPVPNLKKLLFSTRYCHRVTDDALKILGRALSKDFANLQHLGVDFFSCRSMSDQGLVELGQGIGRGLPNLKYLLLDFGENHFLTNEGLVSAGFPIISQLKNLEEIQFHFTYCKQLKDPCVEGLVAKMVEYKSNLSKMRKLVLNFWMCIEVSKACTVKGCQELSFISDVIIRGRTH